MTEIELRALRDSLQESANPPAFDMIAGRRQRRTRRWASLGVACLTVAVFAGAAWGLRERGWTDQPVSPQQSAVSSVSAHASGTLFALDARSQTIKLSKDRGSTWQTLHSGFRDSGTLAAASADSTWLVGDDRVSYVGANLLEAWPVSGPNAFSVAGERLWLAEQGKMTIWSSRRGGAQTSPLPAPVIKVAALSAEAAMVMTMDSSNNVATWYYTSDAGAHWTLRPDPCDAAPTSSNLLASNSFTTIAAAKDRSLWVVCVAESTGMQQPKALLVSTDDGETWQSHGLLEGSGFASAVNAVSATAAWRTGGHSDLYRTVDATRWEMVAPGDGHGFELAAADQDTAIRLDLGLREIPFAYLTRDGGRTWTPVAF